MIEDSVESIVEWYLIEAGGKIVEKFGDSKISLPEFFYKFQIILAQKIYESSPSYKAAEDLMKNAINEAKKLNS